MIFKKVFETIVFNKIKYMKHKFFIILFFLSFGLLKTNNLYQLIEIEEYYDWFVKTDSKNRVLYLIIKRMMDIILSIIGLFIFSFHL